VLGSEWANTVVAAVVDSGGAVCGTAFVVGDDVALTCAHVLAAAEGPVSLRRVGSDILEGVIDRNVDEELDLALVRVPPMPGCDRLVVGSAPTSVGQKIASHGFPYDHLGPGFPEGFTVSEATVAGETDVELLGRRFELLVLDGKGFKEGISGAPAVEHQSEQVAAVFTKYESADRAFAIPARIVRRRWPRLPLEVTGDGASFEHLTSVVDRVAPVAWFEFDAASLHCVVVASEGDPDKELAALLAEALARPRAEDIWGAFTASAAGRLLLGGDVRQFDSTYAHAKVRQASFSVLDAFASIESLATATRLLVEADLVLLDMTGFEPGVMLLAGIRAATRRGVTISSLGTWEEGETLERPFNLSDLSLSSHAPSSTMFGTDPRLDRLTNRISRGFEQYARQPSYLDLPVYDALRRLGSDESAWGSIPLDQEVLVLCSYHDAYSKTWVALRRSVHTALAYKETRPTIARLQDSATPQLASQTLYERVRRCAACIADWTYSSPSTFLELGVRLVASPWGAVQIAHDGWLAAPTDPDRKPLAVSGQLRLMRQLFDPLVYEEKPDAAVGEGIAVQLLRIRGQVQVRSGHPIRQSAIEALATVDERLPDPHELLRGDADALNHLGRTRSNVPQALFYEATAIKADQERAALERRVAAWLYLEHRVNAGELADDHPRRAQWRELAEMVMADLFVTGHDDDLELALRIEEKLS
jgi:hypothetical protein